ncbi:hypothetical protein [uncultured Paludibaculum sp.]|uniref:TOTE conflict system archaeo-eukaryotic primase domain-containing protein n=1 Tax=uncultured Paludibaculum sp. TaxID=1765020 RepID=UPI002AAB0DD7|nr:hypothetical protein [uncultured Paludibaculum sp.]
MTEGLAARFHALFAGLEKGHGTYNNICQQRADGKRTGDPLTKRAPVTDALWQAHLDGENGIGIIPIRDDGTCLFGAVDIDVYDGLDPAAIAAQLTKLKLPLMPCRSKSGGVHVYLFCKEPVPAQKIQERLRDVAARLGHGNSEIFPKQTQTTEKDLGSWINMPYFGGDETNRYGVQPNGDPYTMEGFLTAADAAKVDMAFFDAASEKTGRKKKEASAGQIALPDGPPCLQHLVELGFPNGTRNTGLFALGVYFRRARPSDWQEHIEAANQKYFAEPLPSGEVQPIVGSLARKDYVYMCSKQPLAPHCNAVVCRSRKYGIGGGASGFPILGQLRKLLTTPPVWFLDVTTRDGDVIALEMSTDDLQDPNAFQRQCIDRLDLMPQMPSRVVWQQTINQLLSAVLRLDPPPEDASTEGMFWELLEGFCTGRTQAQSKDEVLLGKPFTENGRTYFRTADLMRYLGQKQFKDYKVQQLAKVLKMRKDPKDPKKDWATHEQCRIGAKVVNLWSVPEFARRDDDFPVADAINKEDRGF